MRKSESGGVTHKKYTNRGKVTVALRSFLAGIRLRGESFLPSERYLSDKLNCSRVVLRKVLSEFEEQGELLKGGKGRIIAPEQAVMRVVFATSGNEAIHGYSWNHLWSVMEPLARVAGIAIDLVLYSAASPLTIEKLGSKLPDAMIFTSMLQSAEINFMTEFKSELPVISIDGNYAETFDFAVTLDDYDVGFRAGKLLKQCGYQQPAFIGNKTVGYLPFKQRQSGFCDAFADGTVKIVQTVDYNQVALIKATVNAVKQLITAGADSLFLYSDELIDFVFQAIAEERSIPDEFGLITLNGSGRSLAHTPQVTAFSHMIPEIARQLISLLTQECNGSLPSTFKIKVGSADVFKGTTIRNYKELIL